MRKLVRLQGLSYRGLATEYIAALSPDQAAQKRRSDAAAQRSYEISERMDFRYSTEAADKSGAVYPDDDVVE